jgi:hypothetical protein
MCKSEENPDYFLVDEQKQKVKKGRLCYLFLFVGMFVVVVRKEIRPATRLLVV